MPDIEQERIETPKTSPPTVDWDQVAAWAAALESTRQKYSVYIDIWTNPAIIAEEKEKELRRRGH